MARRNRIEAGMAQVMFTSIADAGAVDIAEFPLKVISASSGGKRGGSTVRFCRNAAEAEVVRAQLELASRAS